MSNLRAVIGDCPAPRFTQAAALVGGRVALPGQLPWVVHLSLVADPLRGWGQYGAVLTTCTGTLITASSVLTAAHCLERAPNQPAEYVDYVRVSERRAQERKSGGAEEVGPPVRHTGIRVAYPPLLRRSHQRCDIRASRHVAYPPRCRRLQGVRYCLPSALQAPSVRHVAYPPHCRRLSYGGLRCLPSALRTPDAFNPRHGLGRCE